MDVPLNEVAKLAQPISKIVELSAKGISKLPSTIRKTRGSKSIRTFSEKYLLYCNDIYKNMRILSMPANPSPYNTYTQMYG